VAEKRDKSDGIRGTVYLYPPLERASHQDNAISLGPAAREQCTVQRYQKSPQVASRLTATYICDARPELMEQRWLIWERWEIIVTLTEELALAEKRIPVAGILGRIL
jgi:hypothetical protein